MESGSGVLLILSEAPVAVEQRFNEWYDEDHAPARLGVPGIRTARRYKQVGIPGEAGAVPEASPIVAVSNDGSDGVVTYLTAYELDSLEVLNSEEYRALSARAPSELEIEVKKHARFDRRVYRSLQLPKEAGSDDFEVAGEYVLCIWGSPEQQRRSAQELTQIAASPGWLRTRAYALDEGAGSARLTIDDIRSLGAVREVAQRRQSDHSSDAEASDAGVAAADVRLFRLHRRFDDAAALLTSTSALG
jgi:hypothetical protein